MSDHSKLPTSGGSYIRDSDGALHKQGDAKPEKKPRKRSKPAVKHTKVLPEPAAAPANTETEV